jgi:hypothetical protein
MIVVLRALVALAVVVFAMILAIHNVLYGCRGKKPKIVNEVLTSTNKHTTAKATEPMFTSGSIRRATQAERIAFLLRGRGRAKGDGLGVKCGPSMPSMEELDGNPDA